jgi:EAL domain-containing protein (putative c-di-GMP-specific phosphodiesterase class I)
VVVEGIERASQLDHLREHVHAPYAQGYLMHRPMPLDQLLEVLAANREVPGRAPNGQPGPVTSTSVPRY